MKFIEIRNGIMLNLGWVIEIKCYQDEHNGKFGISFMSKDTFRNYEYTDKTTRDKFYKKLLKQST